MGSHDDHLNPEERSARSRARPDHNDPTAGLGGAPPAASALTLRLVLAAIGLVVCTVLAVTLAMADAPVYLWAVLILLAVIAAGDIVVVARRKRRGEPG